MGDWLAAETGKGGATPSAAPVAPEGKSEAGKAENAKKP